MSNYNIPSVSSNANPFLNAQIDSLGESLYSKDSNEFLEEEINSVSYSSILNLLIEIDLKAKENLHKNSTKQTPKKPTFIVNKIEKKTKRGKQSTTKRKKGVHDNTKLDNLIRKIQVHFLTFLVSFCSDAFKKEFKFSNESFKNINYGNKTTVNFDYIYELKNLCIKDLLKMKISKKFKRYNGFYNEELLERIEYSSQWLGKLFEMNYLKLFSYYYNEGRPLDKIVFENEEIILSKETKSFYYLLEKYKYLRQNLINTVESVYFDGKESYESLIEK
jgi:hypothetical protein